MSSRLRRTILLILILSLQVGSAQVSSDWRKRYGQPEAERYALHDGFVLTIFYSQTGQTCKATIQPAKPESRLVFDRMLDEIVPRADRGKEILSIGLSNLVGSTRYERVSVSYYPVSRDNQEEIKSAVVSWNGIQCLESAHADEQ